MLKYNNNSWMVTVLPGKDMANDNQDKSKCSPAGYAALVERYDLNVVPNWHRSFVAGAGARRIDSTQGGIEEV
ncbi:MAG: hypothetical protein PHO93_04910, partial [Candidatus Saccharimonadaceae bacterium]|nr:hypothetical protein [Candidatus Saccharimonadaceae bacterium]